MTHSAWFTVFTPAYSQLSRWELSSLPFSKVIPVEFRDEHSSLVQHWGILGGMKREKGAGVLFILGIQEKYI